MSWSSDQIAALDWIYANATTPSWGTLAAINMSLGSSVYQSTCDTNPLKRTIDLLRGIGVATVIASGNNGQFRKLCELIGRPELADDPRFGDNGKRNVNRADLTKILAEAFADQDGDELSMRLIRNGVPAGPVLPVDLSTSAPHTEHRQMVTEMGWYKGLGTPIKL